MLIQNVHLDNQSETSDVRVTDGKFAAIAPHLTPQAGEEVIDVHGNLMLPPFVDSHVHLDSTLTPANPNGMNQARSLTGFGFGVNVSKR